MTSDETLADATPVTDAVAELGLSSMEVRR
jgi:hypothetical protein